MRRPRKAATPLEVPLAATTDYRRSALATSLTGAMGFPLNESARPPTTATVRVHSALETVPTLVTELLRRLWATQPTSATGEPVSGSEIPSIATNVNEIREDGARRLPRFRGSGIGARRRARSRGLRGRRPLGQPGEKQRISDGRCARHSSGLGKLSCVARHVGCAAPSSGNSPVVAKFEPFADSQFAQRARWMRGGAKRGT